MTLTVLRSSDQLFCCIRWDLSDIFSWLNWVYVFGGRKTAGEQGRSHHIASRETGHCRYWPWSPGWGGVCPVSRLWSPSLTPFFTVTRCGPHSGWGVTWHLLEGSIFHQLLGILLYGRLVAPTYLPTQSLIRISMDSWLFILYPELLSSATSFMLLLRLLHVGPRELFWWLCVPSP